MNTKQFIKGQDTISTSGILPKIKMRTPGKSEMD